MTIIGLVVVVLLILSLFLGQLIESIFANSKDQTIFLERMAHKVADELVVHSDPSGYIHSVNQLLGAMDSGLIFVRSDFEEVARESGSGEAGHMKASQIFTRDELERVFRGETLQVQFSVGPQDEPNNEFIAIAVPVRANQQAGGAVVLYQAVQMMEYTQWHVKLLFFYVAVIGFLLTTFFAFFLSTRITRPLLNLKKAADAITAGEYGTRVSGFPADSTDEIGELAKAFNHMAQKLQETIQDLQHEKEHLSSVLRSMTDAVITFDASGQVISTNPQGKKIIEDWAKIQWEGESRDEEADKQVPLPKPLVPLFEAVVEEEREKVVKLHVLDGVWSVVMTPLYSQNMIRGAVAVLRDVTEEFRLDKLRRDFVANVSHELRTPLSMLQGYSEALIDDIAGSAEERREIAQVIYDESLRMGRLLQDLLDLASMEAGRLQLNKRRVDLRAFLKRVHRKFSTYAKENGIDLVLRLPDEELALEAADEDRLEQVLTNLLDNAIRHTPEGKTITLRTERTADGNVPAALIEVADQGEGIPAEDLPYIFERFYKADKARTRGNSKGGTGLGLAIVRNIVDAHGGKVHVTSAPGQGTTFSVILPLREIS